ncbi:MAG: hypothetical protein LBN04_10970 [Oscillospiraceae bacterium]|jgi:hypothetical protein|nr:hypothetical protein [Oscillospiraceae bacterium]
MISPFYEVIAYMARYWFALLALCVLWGAVRWLRAESVRARRGGEPMPVPVEAPIGDWLVLAAGRARLSEGATLAAPREGWLGGARGCAVRLKGRGMPARAARFALQADGLRLLPRRAGVIAVDGQPVRREAVLRDGAMLTIGDTVLQLQLLDGVIDAPKRVKKPKRSKKAAKEMPPEPLPEPEGRTELPQPALVLRRVRDKKTIGGMHG